MQRLERQPHAGGRAGRQVLHQDIGLGEQAHQHRKRLRMFQIEGQALLGTVGPHEVR